MQVTPGMSAMPDPHADRTALQGGQPMAGAIAHGDAVPPRQSTATPQSAATAAAIAALQVRPVQPMQLPQQQQPVAAAVQSARPVLPTGYGFTPAQLAMLRNQIMAFRRLKVTSWLCGASHKHLLSCINKVARTVVNGSIKWLI